MPLVDNHFIAVWWVFDHSGHKVFKNALFHLMPVKAVRIFIETGLALIILFIRRI